MKGPLWTTALGLARALNDRRASGWRWQRRPLTCPAWCARDHRCTARHGYPSGEHRSEPMIWTTGYGSVATTAVQHIDGAARLELRTTVRLDPATAGVVATALPAGVDLMIRAVLAANSGSAPSALHGAERRAVTR